MEKFLALISTCGKGVNVMAIWNLMIIIRLDSSFFGREDEIRLASGAKPKQPYISPKHDCLQIRSVPLLRHLQRERFRCFRRIYSSHYVNMDDEGYEYWGMRNSSAISLKGNA